jgi:membrane protein YdbS with pleckstrin-like domain
MARFGRNYGRLWRQATWPLRFQLLIDLILPMACVVLFFLGDAVAGVIVVCVILINSAIVWPIIRYRHARQRFRSSGDR